MLSADSKTHFQYDELGVQVSPVTFCLFKVISVSPKLFLEMRLVIMVVVCLSSPSLSAVIYLGLCQRRNRGILGENEMTAEKLIKKLLLIPKPQFKSNVSSADI